MTKVRLLVIGGGAQAKYTLEICKQLNVEVVKVLNLESGHLNWVEHYNVEQSTFNEQYLSQNADNATHAIACVACTKKKRELFEMIEASALSHYTAIHPKSVVASTSEIGSGCIINPLSVIQPFAKIGKGVMVHSHVTIEHDNDIGNFANLAPGSTLTGWVTVNQGANVFSNAVVAPGVSIGKEGVVGALTLVRKDLLPNSKNYLLKN